MRQPDVRRFLFDIQTACRLIEQFTSGRTFEDYTTDPMLRSAVERQFEIVGEALNQMIRAFPAMQDDVPDARRIIAFRNQLIHGYASISNQVVWGVVEGYLPELSRRIEDLLSDRTGDPE